MKKIIQKIVVILLIAIIFIYNISNILGEVYALTDDYIEQIGEAEEHLKYNKKDEKDTYTISNSVVGQYQNNEFYSAYCVGEDFKGTERLVIDIESEVDNDEIWRTIKNGYPYKKAEEMGLSSDFDSYVVTKIAIHCILGKADIQGFTAKDDDEEGQKMLQVLKQLVDIGKNGEEKFDNKIELERQSEIEEEGEYYTITYGINSDAKFSEYKVAEIIGLSEGDKITDIEGNEKKSFEKGEKFKIKISKNNINTNKEIRFEVEANVESYPMYNINTRITRAKNFILTTNPIETVKISGEIKTNFNTGILKVQELDNETKKPIQGVKFELYNSNKELVTTGTTDEEGRIEINNLFQGDYILKEVQTNENYVQDEKSELNIHISYNSTSTVEIEREHKKGDLTIYQVDKDNKEITLGNIGYELYNEETGELIGTYYTDVDGKIEIKNLRIGNYLLREISTNQWYNLADDTKIEIKWKENNEIKIEDELRKGQIKIVAVDKENNEIKIPNAVFEVLDVDGALLEIVRTNEQGEAFTNKYPIRDYQKIIIHENEVDERYNLEEKISEVIVEEGEIKTVIFENEKKQNGQIKITVTSSENNEFVDLEELKGIIFEIYDSKGNLVDTVTTNLQGIATTKKLEKGIYKVKEKNSKENDYTVEIKESEQVVELNVKRLRKDIDEKNQNNSEEQQDNKNKDKATEYSNNKEDQEETEKETDLIDSTDSENELEEEISTDKVLPITGM